MTQKERILHELIQESNGLTAVELQARTGLPEASLRTNLWSMRKDGWVETVGGVRGRYRYGITKEGRRQAPRPGRDAIEEALSRALGTLAFQRSSGEAPSPSEPRRQLLQFARWLVQERADLLAPSEPDIAVKLEDAAADFLYESGRADAIKDTVVSAVDRSLGDDS